MEMRIGAAVGQAGGERRAGRQEKHVETNLDAAGRNACATGRGRGRGLGMVILLLCAAGLNAQTVTVRHQHLRKGAEGVLRVAETGVSFTEAGKGKKHSRTWKFAEMQQVELGAGMLRIVTYEDQKWELGRDREYVFDHLPAGFSQGVYAQWRERLDGRFVADLPDATVAALWERPAKLLGTIRGSQGVVRVGADRIVYETGAAEQSRTWRFADIVNVASAGPFDLSVVTREHHGVWNADTREFRFQLQQALPEAQFNELWRRLNASRQADLINSSMQGKGQDHE